MYTFSTKYIFSGHQSDIVTDVSEGAALKKMKQFQRRKKGNGSKGIWEGEKTRDDVMKQKKGETGGET